MDNMSDETNGRNKAAARSSAAERRCGDVVGYDVSTDWFDPTVVCAECYDDDDAGAAPLARGEEWWNHDGRCHRCGSEVDLTVVYD